MKYVIGPNGEKRPTDPVAQMVRIAKIATGEIDEKPARRIVLEVIVEEEAD